MEFMVTGRGTDRDWKIWGETNPYFGVLTDPKFLNANLNKASLQEFFASGELHVEHVYATIRARIQTNFQPARVLDYGCGVGRLVVPFAKRAEMVVGVDVSPGMLDQAKRNCEKYGATSASLLLVDEMDSLEPASFGLVHSYIVFQHIPVARGEIILNRLITLIKDGGVGAIHLTYSYPGRQSLFRRFASALIQRVGFLRGFRNLTRHMPFSSPSMQMNKYSMNRILDILIDQHCSNLHVEFSNHGGCRGTMLYFEKVRPFQPLRTGQGVL
jgi:SAM-dependent methyltransferase